MQQKIAKLRKKIDIIDGSIIKQIVRRLSVVKKINTLKKKTGLPLLDARRETAIKTRRKKIAQRLGISSSFLEQVFQIIIDEGKKLY